MVGEGTLPSARPVGRTSSSSLSCVTTAKRLLLLPRGASAVVVLSLPVAATAGAMATAPRTVVRVPPVTRRRTMGPVLLTDGV